MVDVIQHYSKPLIEVHENFITKEECEKLLSLPVEYNSSQGWDSNNDQPHRHESRTSSTAFAGRWTPRFKKHIANYFNIPVERIEDLQYQRYEPGQRYLAHHDYFTTGKNLENNRVFTFIVYLNDDFQGGFTEFPKLGLGFKPKAGSGIFFRYDYADPSINDLTLHAGTDVISGQKVIMTAWFREKSINR